MVRENERATAQDTVQLPPGTIAFLEAWARRVAAKPIPDELALKIARLWDVER